MPRRLPFRAGKLASVGEVKRAFKFQPFGVSCALSERRFSPWVVSEAAQRFRASLALGVGAGSRVVAAPEGACALARTPRLLFESSEAQLYNLAEDIGETKNLAPEHPERVKELSDLLQRIRSDGRSQR
jgi:hypothetical protein